MKISKCFLAILLVLALVACKTQNTAVKKQDETSTSMDAPKVVNIRGEQLHYIDKGKGEPLIFVHSSISDYRSFFSRVEPYSKDYHVVTYSRRYAWPNKQVFDKTVDYSARIHADDLYALIQKLGFQKVHLVCHSYGALTALTMALEHPEVVKSLVLGEPPIISLAENTEKGRKSWDSFIKDDLRPAKQDFLADKDEEALEHFLKGVFGSGFQLAQVPPEAKQLWMDNLLETWGLSMSEDFVRLDSTAIQSLNIPVLLLDGNRSPVYLKEISEELHRLLPDSQRLTLENSSHGLYFEQPEQADRAVMEFLAEH